MCLYVLFLLNCVAIKKSEEKKKENTEISKNKQTSKQTNKTIQQSQSTVQEPVVKHSRVLSQTNPKQSANRLKMKATYCLKQIPFPVLNIHPLGNKHIHINHMTCLNITKILYNCGTKTRKTAR